MPKKTFTAEQLRQIEALAFATQVWPTSPLQIGPPRILPISPGWMAKFRNGQGWWLVR